MVYLLFCLCLCRRFEVCKEPTNKIANTQNFDVKENKTKRQPYTIIHGTPASPNIYSKFKSWNRFSLIYVVSQLVFVLKAPSHSHSHMISEWCWEIACGIILRTRTCNHCYYYHIGIYFTFWFRSAIHWTTISTTNQQYLSTPHKIARKKIH